MIENLPTIYDTPTIYKTAGGVYNSSGVYNGGVYNGGGSDPDVIGGRKYLTVEIGSQIWLAENLDFQFDGLLIITTGGSSTDAKACYPANNPSLYGIDAPRKCGLLYNFKAVQEIINRDLAPGWHVPTMAEFETLFSSVGGSAADLKAVNLDWATSWGGNNSSGFDLRPAGWTGDASNQNRIGQIAFLWSSELQTSDRAKDIEINQAGTIDRTSSSFNVMGNIRLVRNI